MTTTPQTYQWYLARDGKRYGPIEPEELFRLEQAGHIQDEDKLWRQGFDDWLDAFEVLQSLNGERPGGGQKSAGLEQAAPFELGKSAQEPQKQAQGARPQMQAGNAQHPRTQQPNPQQSSPQQLRPQSQNTQPAAAQSSGGPASAKTQPPKRQAPIQGQPSQNASPPMQSARRDGAGHGDAAGQPAKLRAAPGNTNPPANLRATSPQPHNLRTQAPNTGPSGPQAMAARDTGKPSQGKPSQAEASQRTQDPNFQQARPAGSRNEAPRTRESRTRELRAGGPRAGEPRRGEQRTGEPRLTGTRADLPGENGSRPGPRLNEPAFAGARPGPQDASRRDGPSLGDAPLAAPNMRAPNMNQPRTMAPRTADPRIMDPRIMTPRTMDSAIMDSRASGHTPHNMQHTGAMQNTGRAASYALPRRPRRNWFRGAIYTFAVFFMLCIGAVIALPILVPTDAIERQVISLVKEKTGRDLVIRGKTSFTFFPNIGVKLHDIALSNPAGMSGPPLLRISAVDVNMKLMPLLRQQFEVERFILIQPKLALQVDRAGYNNWSFSQLNAPALKRNGESAAARTEETGHALLRKVSLHKVSLRDDTVSSVAANPAQEGLRTISLGQIRIEQGSFTYSDEESGKVQKAERIDMTVTMKTPQQPLQAKGSMVWNEEKVRFSSKLASLQAVLEQTSSPIEVKLDAALLQSQFEGRIIFVPDNSAIDGKAMRIEGVTQAKSRSLAQLAGWFGAALTMPNAAGPISFSSKIQGGSDKWVLTRTKVQFDKMNAAGQGVLTLGNVKPHLKADLTLDHLRLGRLLGAEGEVSNAERAAYTGAIKPVNEEGDLNGPGVGPKADEKRSLTELIETINKDDSDSGARPRNKAQLGQATDRPYAGLLLLDADLDLTVSRVSYQKVKIGRSDMTVALKNGIVTANLKKLALYDGSAVGQMKFNSARTVPSFTVALTIDKVKALPFLKDAADFNWVSGTGRFVLALSGAGFKHAEIVKSLEGRGSLRFEDGALEGVNIPQMARGLQNGQIPSFSRDGAQKTDFSELTGTYIIKAGVVTNKDLKMVGPLLRMSGAGTADINQERLDYKFNPRIVANLEGQGAQDADAEGGLLIPVQVSGPWRAPKIVPDLEAVMRNPEALSKSVSEVGKAVEKLTGSKVKGKDFESLVKGFLRKSQ